MSRKTEQNRHRPEFDEKFTWNPEYKIFEKGTAPTNYRATGPQQRHKDISLDLAKEALHHLMVHVMNRHAHQHVEQGTNAGKVLDVNSHSSVWPDGE